MSSISSSAAAASASSAWADMPFELFGIIFAHVPLRARLRVVSAVCQRWRRAVLRMPVRWYRTNVPSAAIRLLNVTELDVRSIFPFPLPKSLHSLHINTTRSHVTSRHCYRGPCLCSPFRSVTSGLTSLRVAIEEPSDPCYKQMLTDNQFTLTDLRIDRVVTANVFDIIPPVRVPNLRRLSLSSHFDNREFLALHAAQLTRLRLDLPDAQLVFANVTDLHLRCAAVPSVTMLRSNFPRLRDLRITMTRNMHVAAEIQDFAAFIRAASPFLVSLASTDTHDAPLVECARLRVLETLPTLEPPLPQLRAYVSMRVPPTANLRTLHLYTKDVGTQESFPSSLSTLRIYLSAHNSDSIAPLNLASFNTLLTTLAAECPRLRVFGLWTDRPLLATQLSALQAFLLGALRRSLTRFISFALCVVDSADKDSRLSVAQILRSDAALDCLTVSEVLCDGRPPIDLLRAEEEEEDRNVDSC